MSRSVELSMKKFHNLGPDLAVFGLARDLVLFTDLIRFAIITQNELFPAK